MIELPPPSAPDPPIGRTRHPFFMHEMIRRQAVAARATHRATRDALLGAPLAAPTDRLLLVGLGTSYHAALAAAFAASAGRGDRPDVQARTAFDLLEDPAVATPGTTAVVFSAGGETALTMAAQRLLRSRGCRSLLITAKESAPSSALADRVLVTQYADETSWTHTVSFTAALVAFGALLDHWQGVPGTETVDEDAVADLVTAALATEPGILDVVETLAPCEEILLLGSGAAEATAREGALKLREAAGRFSAAVGVEEFLHGVLPSVGTSTAVIAIAGTESERVRAQQGLRAAELAGAHPLLIDSSGGAAGPGIFSVPSAVRPMPPVLQVIPLQFLAYWISVSEGRNPDVMGLDDPRILAGRSSFGI
ncbi:MAG: SIS domain-containing protein [Thermoplasmata archaeon]|nr:SIS domain-containing protein [Thermoplasmata archaeon]